MINGILPLVNYANGMFVLAIFGLVCIALIATVLIFMFGGKEKKE